MHQTSSRCIFCVSDFEDQVDNLSSNYLYPLQPVIAQHGLLPEECQKGRYAGWREAAEKDPLGFLMQMMHSAESSQRRWENPDWKGGVCSICYFSSLFINAAYRQAESQLVKRYRLDRPKVWISCALAGSDVYRGLTTAHLQFQVKTQLSCVVWLGNKHDLGQWDGLGCSSPHSHCLTVGPSEHKLG